MIRELTYNAISHQRKLACCRFFFYGTLWKIMLYYISDTRIHLSILIHSSFIITKIHVFAFIYLYCTVLKPGGWWDKVCFYCFYTCSSVTCEISAVNSRAAAAPRNNLKRALRSASNLQIKPPVSVLPTYHYISYRKLYYGRLFGKQCSHTSMLTYIDYSKFINYCNTPTLNVQMWS